MTFITITDWIIANRKKDAYKDSTRESIFIDLLKHSKQGTLYVITDCNNNITALATASYEADNYMKVNNVIALNHYALVQLIKYFIKQWPNKSIISNIRGRIRHFDKPEKLLHKLETIWAKT